MLMARSFWARRAELPVVELELGDSWIYGSASDPHKTRRLLALQRLYDEFAAEGLTPARRAFGRGLALVAEHTCGVDIKSYLRDETAWDRPAFEALRRTDYRFAYTEASWTEQHAYFDAALAELSPPDQAKTAAVADLDTPASIDRRRLAHRSRRSHRRHRHHHQSIGREFAKAPTAACSASATRATTTPTSSAGWTPTSPPRPEWAVYDHGKPGLVSAKTASSKRWATRMISGVRIVDTEAHDKLGAPARIDFAFRSIDAASLEIAVTLIDKPANRMPEASFVAFTPSGAGDWRYLKTGLWLDPSEVTPLGGSQLQAVAAIRRDNFILRPLDTPLVAPAEAGFMAFHTTPVPLDRGIRFNIHNNKWGTNFPQWWGAKRFTARFMPTLTHRRERGYFVAPEVMPSMNLRWKIR